MSITEFIRTIDGGVAVSVMLFWGWRVERLVTKHNDQMWQLIDKLTNGGEVDNEERDTSRMD